MPKFTIRTLLLITLIVGFTLSTPSLLGYLSRMYSIRRATAGAQTAFNNDSFFLYRTAVWTPDSPPFYYNFDSTTGLPLCDSFSENTEYCTTFNREVLKKLKNADSSFALQPAFAPTPEILVDEFASNDYTVIESFPFELSDSITVKFFDDGLLVVNRPPPEHEWHNRGYGIRNHGKLSVGYKLFGELIYLSLIHI